MTWATDLYSTFTVIYDSCVLYPAPLRDLLMRLAITDLFRARWTDDIHEEWIASLLSKRSDIPRSKLEAVRNLMDTHCRDCLVTGYKPIIESLSLPDPDDRHVLAAAIVAKASVIVTFNEKDFPEDVLKEYGIESQHPDEFITHLIDLSPPQVCIAAKQQRASLKHPEKSVSEFLEILAKQQLIETSYRFGQYRDLI